MYSLNEYALSYSYVSCNVKGSKKKNKSGLQTVELKEEGEHKRHSEKRTLDRQRLYGRRKRNCFSEDV